MYSYLFYGGTLVKEYDHHCPYMGEYLQTDWGREIYNGGYLYTQIAGEKTRQWYRPDYTPVVESEVPKEYRLQLAILQ